MIELRRNRDIYDILESSESTNIIWMTKEDYESLSDNEKNNGLYYGVINNPLREALNPISTPSSILVYTGTAISPNWNYDPLTLEISGDITGTNVGEYTTIFTPKDGYVWNNGSTKPQYVTWKIGLAKVKLINDSDYEYDGKTKTLNIENYIPSLMSASGTTSASAVGFYSATYSLNEGMFWADGSTDDITINWSISRQVANIQYIKTIDSYDIRLYEASATIALGTIYCPTSISISYSNSGIVTASISNGMLYVTTSSNFGSTSITLTPQSDDYHDAGPAITIGPLNKNEITATVTLDLTNSDPSKWATYSGDYWDQGSDNWDKFFGYYPVVLRSSGTEYKKLSMKSATTSSYNDYYRYFEDGTSTNGICNDNSNYHTMVCFPRRGIKITINHGVSMEISMTNNPNKSGYSYMAHTYKGTSKNKIYIGAHKLYYDGSNLYNGYRSGNYSYSGSYNPSQMRSYVQAKGTGFELMGWDQNTYILVMYTLKYKAANSTNYLSNNSLSNGIYTYASTVSSNTLDYNSYGQIFGLSNFTCTQRYGEYIEGAYAYGRYLKICTNNNYANSINSNYANRAYFSSNISGSSYAFKEPIGDNFGGFYPDPSYYSGGSTTTYFCTYAYFYYNTSSSASYCLCRGYCSSTANTNYNSIYCISGTYLQATANDYYVTYRMMYYG